MKWWNDEVVKASVRHWSLLEESLWLNCYAVIVFKFLYICDLVLEFQMSVQSCMFTSRAIKFDNHFYVCDVIVLTFREVIWPVPISLTDLCTWSAARTTVGIVSSTHALSTLICVLKGGTGSLLVTGCKKTRSPWHSLVYLTYQNSTEGWSEV